MVGYLVKKILALVLFAAAMVVVPFALPLAMVISVLVGACRMIAHSGDHGIDFKEAALSFGIGLVAFFASFRFLNIYSSPNAQIILMAVFCGITIYAGVQFRGLARQEDRVFYMSATVRRFTKPHPYLLIVAGVLRLLIEAGFRFFSEEIAPFTRYTEIGIVLGNILFVAAIVMYVVRTIHIFKLNR